MFLAWLGRFYTRRTITCFTAGTGSKYACGFAAGGVIWYAGRAIRERKTILKKPKAGAAMERPRISYVTFELGAVDNLIAKWLASKPKEARKSLIENRSRLELLALIEREYPNGLPLPARRLRKCGKYRRGKGRG